MRLNTIYFLLAVPQLGRLVFKPAKKIALQTLDESSSALPIRFSTNFLMQLVITSYKTVSKSYYLE